MNNDACRIKRNLDLKAYCLTQLRMMKNTRYVNLLRTIRRNGCRRILEIGTFDGRHAIQFIDAAKTYYHPSDIYYFGFDLFESLDSEKLAREASKRPPAMQEVLDRLERTGAQIRLHQGDTTNTLPKAKNELGTPDLIFIDGGHSFETIESDWNNVKDLMTERTTVIFDDFYSNSEPAMTGFGCQALIRSLDEHIYDVDILQPTDRYSKDWGVLKINLVQVSKAKV